MTLHLHGCSFVHRSLWFSRNPSKSQLIVSHSSGDSTTQLFKFSFDCIFYWGILLSVSRSGGLVGVSRLNFPQRKCYSMLEHLALAREFCCSKCEGCTDFSLPTLALRMNFFAKKTRQWNLIIVLGFNTHSVLSLCLKVMLSASPHDICMGFDWQLGTKCYA